MPSHSDYDQIDNGDVVPDRIELTDIVGRPKSHSAVSSIPDNSNTATWSSCFLSVTCSLIGTGIVGMPFAFAKCGWILGSLLIFLSAAVSAFGSHLLAVCALKTPQPSSFYSIAQIVMPKFAFAIELYIAATLFGVTTSYLFVIGDSLPLALRELNAPLFFQNRVVCILMMAILFCIPFSLLPSLDSLRYTSLLSSAMLFYLAMLIALYSFGIPNFSLLDPCFQHGNNPDGSDATTNVYCAFDYNDRNYIQFDIHTLKVLPIFLYNFSCQQNVFVVANEVKSPTLRKINSIFTASVVTAGVLYVITACCAYATFGVNIVSDILQMYPGNILTTFCRIFISFVVALNYPILLNPCRSIIVSHLSRIYDHDKDDSADAIEVKMWRANRRFYAVTAVHLLLSMLIAISFHDLAVIFIVVGATGSTLIILILPGLYYYLIHKSGYESPDTGSTEDTSGRFSETSSSGGSSGLDDRSTHNLIRNGGNIVHCNGGANAVENGYHADDGTAAATTEKRIDGRNRVFSDADSTIHENPGWKLHAALAMFIFGMILMPVCLVLSFM